MTEDDALVHLAWAAGLFEGEGSISRQRANSDTWTIAITMTDRDVVARFHSVIGIGRIYGPYHYNDYPGRRRSHHKRFWRWSIHDRESVLLFSKLLGGWFCKRRRAKLKEAVRSVKHLVARPNMVKRQKRKKNAR